MSKAYTAAEIPELEDDPWDAFLEDDDLEPEPEPGDFSYDDDVLPFKDISTGVLFAIL